MSPETHYNPELVQCPIANNICLLFALEASNDWNLEHMDIVNAYVHESPAHTKPISFLAMQNSRGRVMNGNTIGRIQKILGGKYAGDDYITEIFGHLKAEGYTPADSDESLFSKHTLQCTTLVGVTVDEFLATARLSTLANDFHDTQERKYHVKRLVKPNQFLDWLVTYWSDGTLKLIQPTLVKATIENANQAKANGSHTPYNEHEGLRPPHRKTRTCHNFLQIFVK